MTICSHETTCWQETIPFKQFPSIYRMSPPFFPISTPNFKFISHPLNFIPGKFLILFTLALFFLVVMFIHVVYSTTCTLQPQMGCRLALVRFTRVVLSCSALSLLVCLLLDSLYFCVPSLSYSLAFFWPLLPCVGDFSCLLLLCLVFLSCRVLSSLFWSGPILFCFNFSWSLLKGRIILFPHWKIIPTISHVHVHVCCIVKLNYLA